MYNLIIILATGITTVGTYPEQATCQAQLPQFHRQSVTAACVKQESDEDVLARGQLIMKRFMSMMETK
jgi:hypothetical protein